MSWRREAGSSLGGSGGRGHIMRFMADPKSKVFDSTGETRPVPAASTAKPADPPGKVPEVGGRGGPDPTRYGDWEKDGRCVDF